jgi:hypothetical protein
MVSPAGMGGPTRLFCAFFWGPDHTGRSGLQGVPGAAGGFPSSLDAAKCDGVTVFRHVSRQYTGKNTC